MIAWRQKTTFAWAMVASLIFIASPLIAFAAQSSSNTYQVNEVFFGSGGQLRACGAAYCSKQSAGELASGRFSSNSYQAQAGFNTDRMPFIEAIVNNSNTDLGSLNASTTKTATATFSVKAYLAHGYTVANASDAPQNNTYTMQNLTIPSASSAGLEQFGINLVANTLPVNFGAGPVQSPNNSFSFGIVTADYSSSDLYKYVKGDVIAYSTSSTSSTNYTVSYIFNVSNITPGGTYVMRHVLVATATY